MVWTKAGAAALLACLLAGGGTVLAAERADGAEGLSDRALQNGTNGVEFGSDAELGLSGSTPGILIDRGGRAGGGDGSFRAASADADRNDGASWGLLGLLGLIGLAGRRRVGT